MKPLSHTRIKLYLQCPLKYKFQYIDGLKEKPKPYFSFGNSIHQALEFFYSPKLPKAPSREDVLKHYRDNWISKGYKDAVEEKEYLEFGETMLRDFYDKHIEGYKLPMNAEQTIFFEVDGVKVTAVIDRIDKISDGAVQIVDYKTNKDPFTLSKLNNEPQLTMYQLAVEMEFGMRVEKLTYYHLRSQTPFTVPRHDDARVKELKSRIVGVAGDIAEGKFPHKQNTFCPCDFAHLCPLYMHEYKKEEPGNRKVIDIVKVADKYGELKEQDKEIKAKIDALQSEIKEFMNGEKMERVFGDKYEVTRSKGSKEYLNNTEAKKILQENNLLEGLTFCKETETIRYKERKEEVDRG